MAENFDFERLKADLELMQNDRDTDWNMVAENVLYRLKKMEKLLGEKIPTYGITPANLRTEDLLDRYKTYFTSSGDSDSQGGYL